MISRWPSWQARYSGVAPVLVWALSVLQEGHRARHPWPLHWDHGYRVPGPCGSQGHGDVRDTGKCRGDAGWVQAVWIGNNPPHGSPLGPRTAAATAVGGH